MAFRIRHPRLLAYASLVVVLALLWAGGLVATVRPIGGSTAGNSEPSSGLAFSPDAYVARIWGEKVVPAARHDSVALPKLLAAIGKDRAAALKQFGHRAAGTYNIMVHFTGTVAKIDTSSPIGTLTVDVADGHAPINVKVATGPVILGTTLRDALKFISFGEFLNQIQYGNVADALNTHVVKDVVGPRHVARLKGRTVTVFGAYTYNDADPRDITVVPVILRPAGEAAP